MRYVDNVELELYGNNKIRLGEVYFKESMCKPCNDLYDSGFLDKKDYAILGNIGTKLRFSEYLPIEKVSEIVFTLKQFYNVDYFEATYYYDDKVMFFNDYQNRNIVRIFPIEDYKKMDKIDRIQLGVIYIGNDKNKSIKARQEAKNTPSGTTSKNNNAIQNVKQLGKVNHHNLRQYDNNQELIKTIKGSNDIVKDVKDLYIDLFDEARLEYNNKQTRDDRKIDNYFNKISNDTKHDLACEIIIELGNMEYWDEKSLEYKYQMTQVFEQQLEDLKEIVPDFYIANATIHFDEHSPHMHIVGVPVKENCKTGLSRQVGKTTIFTKESLVVIQDKMRERCIEEFNIAYRMDSKLKEKQKGKNRDITSYERKLFNERVKGLKQEISNFQNEVSDLEDNKESINKQITKLSKDKDSIKDEIDKKKKINNKFIIKFKN